MSTQSKCLIKPTPVIPQLDWGIQFLTSHLQPLADRSLSLREKEIMGRVMQGKS